jgi:hypothetical protein
VPRAARIVEDAEALTVQACVVFIDLMQDAAAEYPIDADVGVLCAAINFEDVPISNPEIELTIFRSGAGCGLQCLSVAAEGQNQKQSDKRNKPGPMRKNRHE